LQSQSRNVAIQRKYTVNTNMLYADNHTVHTSKTIAAEILVITSTLCYITPTAQEFLRRLLFSYIKLQTYLHETEF